MTIKLDTSNFIIWKCRWENVLRATSLIEYEDGSLPCPPNTMILSNKEVPNPVAQKWMMIDAHLLSCLTATLAPVIFSVAINCLASSEAWYVLEKRFTSLSRSHIHQLKNKLSEISKNLSSMKDYLQQIKTIVDQ